MNHDDQKKMDCGVEILNIFLMVDETPKDAYEIRDKYWAFSLDVDRVSRVLSDLYKKGYIERTICPEGSCKYSYFIRSDISKEMLLVKTVPTKKGVSDDYAADAAQRGTTVDVPIPSAVDCIPKGVISEKTKIE